MKWFSFVTWLDGECRQVLIEAPDKVAAENILANTKPEGDHSFWDGQECILPLIIPQAI